MVSRFSFYNILWFQGFISTTFYGFKIFNENCQSFSSKWGNFRRCYFVAAPGTGYRGSVAQFRIEKDAKEPRHELRLNFSRLQPQTVLKIIGKIGYLWLKHISANNIITCILAALMLLYRSGRVETLKQFCGVVPGDRSTRSFLDPLEVSETYL